VAAARAALRDDDLPSAVQRFGVDAALLTLQALAQAGLPSAPRLWIATAGSQSVDGTEELRITQAPVAGLARVAATEHPELRVTLVDLDPQATPSDARLLLDEMLSGSEENQVALRKGVRYAARLARQPRSSAPHIDRRADPPEHHRARHARKPEPGRDGTPRAR
jgi:hypothetical protein